MELRRIVSIVMISWIAPFSLHALDLRSALAESISTNPDIAQKRHELSLAYHELDIARSGFLPKIDVRSSAARERANTQMTGFQSRDFNTLNTNITLTQNLFSGFSTSAETAAKQHAIEMSMYALEEKTNDLALRLIKGYLEVLKSHELMAIEKENVAAHEAMHHKITLKTQSGSARNSDHKEVMAKLALSYVNALTQDNNYNDAAAALNQILGHYVDAKRLTKPLIEGANIPVSLDKALTEALDKHPSILVGRAEVQSSKESVGLEKSSYYPKVDAELNARNYNNASGTENVDKTAAAMVTLSYNLYNGGSDEARIKRSLAMASTATERLRSIERGVMEEMTLAYNSYQILDRQKPFLELYCDANKDKTALYHEEYDLGRRSLIDLLDAEDEYATSKRKVIENEYDRLYAYFRLLAAKNGLIEAFGIGMSGNNPKDATIEERIKEAPSVGTYPDAEQFRRPLKPLSTQLPKESAPSVNSPVIDPQKGYQHYLIAARLGDKPSQKIVASLYEKGIGTKADPLKAAYWRERMVRPEKRTGWTRIQKHRRMAEGYLPINEAKAESKKESPPPSMHERAKSLGERLKELGII